MFEQRIGFIGAGQMARALAHGFVRAGLVRPERIVAFDPVPAAAQQFAAEIGAVQLVADNSAVIRAADIVFLAVKPQSVSGVAQQLPESVPPGVLVVSIVAGLSLASMARLLGTTRLVRVMPNTPCLIGQGASGYALGPTATEADSQLVGQLLGAVGTALRLDEGLLDAVTGLSGSGPAYVYMLIEALSDGGVRVGLPRATATALAAQTVRGAAEMVLTGGEHPAVLKDRVTSPGGTTIAGLQALEEHGFRAAAIAAVQAATERARELSRLAEKA